jgi:formate hydrogenlyase subunit 3/multisubunit Na+/H+ antiporter MnhD subunit
MIVISLAILLLGAALCFGLSRVLPTRVVGAGAAALCWAATAPALAGAPQESAATIDLLTLGGAAFSLATGLSDLERGVAAALLVSAGAALLALATAVAGAVRGFGALFGWALLCVAAALLSLAAPPLSLLQPFAWAVLSIAGYGALRASGAEMAVETPPLGLTFGLLASALLAVALVAAGPALAGGELPFGPAAAAGLAAALAVGGFPPLLTAREEAVAGPAPLGALVFGIAAPAAGLGWLLRATAALPAQPAAWSVMVGLIGAVGALACGAGAVGERRLRPILAWSAGAQAGLVIAAAGLGGPLGAVAGPSLLTALMLSATLSAGAALSFERATGTDDYTEAAEAAPRAAALIWAAGSAASLGLPPLWGFWGRLWLLEDALERQPWLVAPLLAGSVLLALALATALAGLWSAARAERGATAWGAWAPALVVCAPLLVLGAAPGLAWERWLRAVPFAPPAAPLDPRALAAAIAAGALLLVLAALPASAAPTRAVKRDPDEDTVRLAPDTLGKTLRPLAWLANPAPLIAGVGALLERSSELMRLLVGLFEQRYYLLGVLAALITIMLLMAQ